MKTLKKKILVNRDNRNNIKIFNINEDKFYDLNETASIIFENIDKPIEIIMKIMKEKYIIKNSDELKNDIENIRTYILKKFYAK